MNAIIQRLLAETSPWFKKAQIFFVIILAVINGLHSFIPADIISHANWIGVALIIFCSFTVNDATLLLTNGLNMQTVFAMIAALPGQLEQLKGAVDGKLSLEQAKQLAGLQVTKPVIPPTPAENTPIPNPIPATGNEGITTV